jgi:transcriptional regulator GlxA family with amidase domain
VVRWTEENAGRDRTLAEVAARASTGGFREQPGSTPLRSPHRARARRARYLLETSGHPVERIAAQVGSGSATAFRKRFRRVVATSPPAYGASFRPAGLMARRRR